MKMRLRRRCRGKAFVSCRYPLLLSIQRARPTCCSPVELLLLLLLLLLSLPYAAAAVRSPADNYFLGRLQLLRLRLQVLGGGSLVADPPTPTL